MARNSAVLVNLNVGGTKYSTMLSSLTREKDSPLATYFMEKFDQSAAADPTAAARQRRGQHSLDDWIVPCADGSFFIDRDAHLFRYVLDYLRTGRLLLPEKFAEAAGLKSEAQFYQLNGLADQLTRSQTPNGHLAASFDTLALPNENDGYITLGYRGSFAFGRDGQADVKFRKVQRILVSGKASLCRDVFGDTLNESRDPEREGSERYTSRLYLKHQCVEKAFDCLLAHGFRLQAAMSSGANGVSNCQGTMGGGMMHHGHNMPNAPGMQNSPDARGSVDVEEHRWARYSEFVFARITGGAGC